MTFPLSLQEVIDRLRVENEVENADIQLMMDAAVSAVRRKVKRPIEAANRTWTIEDGYTTTFFLPLYPVKHADTDLVTILDADGDAVTDFRVNTETGQVFASGDTVFNNFPYTVTAKVGLDLMPDYATEVEPVLNAAFFDIVADFYQRRSPNAFAEGAGGGVITQYQAIGIPDRACQLLESLKLAKAH